MILRSSVRRSPRLLHAWIGPLAAASATTSDESRWLPTAPVSRATDELERWLLHFESPTDGTEEFLGREQNSQSIASEGAIGRPFETCLVLPRASGRGCKKEPLRRIGSHHQVRDFNNQSVTCAVTPLPLRLLTIEAINGFGRIRVR